MQKREDSSVGPYSQCQRQHSNSGKGGRLAEHAYGEAQILPERLNKALPAGRADDFLRNFEAPPLQAYSAKRILAAHPLLDLFFGGHLLVGAKLLIQLPVDLLLSEQ